MTMIKKRKGNTDDDKKEKKWNTDDTDQTDKN